MKITCKTSRTCIVCGQAFGSPVDQAAGMRIMDWATLTHVRTMTFASGETVGLTGFEPGESPARFTYLPLGGGPEACATESEIRRIVSEPVHISCEAEWWKRFGGPMGEGD